MHDSFNPYREWLGISGGENRPNHYALLGLSNFESDSAKISAAAEWRIAEVFRLQAAPRLALWQRILSELADAKSTLCDPAEKLEYDAILRRELALGRSDSAQSLAAPPAQAGRNILPPSAKSLNPLPPAATGSAHPPATAAQQTEVDPMAPVSLPSPASVDPMAPVSTDVPAQITPEAAAERAPPSFVSASAVDEGELAPSLPRRTAIAVSARRRQKHQSIVGAVCLLLLGAGAAAGVGYATGLLRLDRDREISQSSDNGAGVGNSAKTETAHDDRQHNAAATKVEKTEIDSNTNSTERNVNRLPAAIGNGDDARTSETKTDTATTQPVTVARPNANPPPDTAPADPAKARRLKLELANARLALGKREWEAAQRHLDESRQLVTTPDDQALVDAMARVQEHVAGFWQAVAEGVKGVDQTGELQVGSTFVSIVETGPDHILIRAAGENRRYTMKQLPSGLAMALANRWFDSKPDNDVFRGAFMFVDPKGGADEAKRLWQQAGNQDSQLGTDALLKLLPLSEIETVGGVAVVKGPAPDSAQVEQAQQRIRDESAADFTAASTSIKKYELAKKLIQSASQSDLEPAPRFALLSLARDLATEANQPGSAIEAAELLTKWFEGDAIATRLRTLEQLKPANAVAAKAIAQAGLTLFDEAIRANQAEAAKRIGQLTLAAAQKSQSADLVKQARERVAKAGAKK